MKVYIVKTHYFFKYADVGGDESVVLGVYPDEGTAVDAVIDVIARTASSINTRLVEESSFNDPNFIEVDYDALSKELKETYVIDIDFLNVDRDFWGDYQRIYIIEKEFNSQIDSLI